MAYFDVACLDGPSSRLTARIDLPTTARTLRVAVDLVASSTLYPLPSRVLLIVAGARARTVVDVVSTVGRPATPLPPGPFPYYHTGFKDLSVDVTAFAGESVALFLGRDPTDVKGCGPSGSPSLGMLVDDLRVE